MLEVLQRVDKEQDFSGEVDETTPISRQMVSQLTERRARDRFQTLTSRASVVTVGKRCLCRHRLGAEVFRVMRQVRGSSELFRLDSLGSQSVPN